MRGVPDKVLRTNPAPGRSRSAFRQALQDEGRANGHRLLIEQKNDPKPDRAEMPPASSASAGARAGNRRRFSSTARTVRQDDEARIHNALRIIAKLLEDDEAYLPVFLRLEAELDEVKARHSALDRARAYSRASR